MLRRHLIKTLGGGAAALALPGLALSQTRPIKIGLPTDYSGPYRDNNGPGEEYSAQLAIQDFNGGKVLGRPVELLVGDHLNKADVCTEIAKRWLEVDKVDLMIPSGSSVAALAAHTMSRDRGVITMMTASAAINFSEKDCSPLGFHWTMDTYAYPRSAVIASGDLAKKKWFFIAIDNVFGETLLGICNTALKEAGGQMIGSVRHPINTTDFASFIAQAQTSKADAVVFANAGADQVRLLKQAHEFGLRAGGQAIVCPNLVFTDLLAAGMEATQGIKFADTFYWNYNDATRAFSKRFFDKIGRMPAMSQGHIYAAVTHYLQAVEAVKTTESKAVAARFRSQPITSKFYTNTSIRPNGRMVSDLVLMQVKAPAQAKDKFDAADVIGSIPGDKVFKPIAQTECKQLAT
jgi:branched-chain amino acid transport system substrate-binding protein